MSSTSIDSSTWHPSLTTQFTPPPACTPTDTWANAQYTSPLIIQRILEQSSSCFAPGWTSAPNIYAHGGNTWTGAPFCPRGQTVGLSQTDLQGKTTAVCCSSGWGNAGTGINVVSTPGTYTFWSCATSFSSTTTSVGSPVGAPGSLQLTGDGSIESTVEYIFVYDQKDLATTSTRSLSQTTQPATANSPSTINPPITATPQITTISSSGLSSGAEAGIGVGVAIGALALIGAGVLYFVRRRKRRGVEGAGGRDYPPELDGNQRVELQGEAKPLELPAHQDMPPELPGQSRYTELESE